jgi:hypothetical protein
LKANGKIATDTNAVIAYRAGVPQVCAIIKAADIILVPAPVVGELLPKSFHLHGLWLRKGLQDRRHTVSFPLITVFAEKKRNPFLNRNPCR